MSSQKNTPGNYWDFRGMGPRDHWRTNCDPGLILRLAGFAHFFRPKIQGLFKDFQGPNFEISRTSFLFTSMNLPIEMV